VKGEISSLTTLIYEARENALRHIELDADQCGADQVVGIKTYVYNLGGGIIEFLAIGTAVKKIDGLTTQSDQLIPQAIIRDQDTFINTADGMKNTALDRPQKNAGVVTGVIGVLIFILVVIFKVLAIFSQS